LTDNGFCVINNYDMDKKDIYEHLAKIYLDVSSEKKKKSKAHRRTFVFRRVFLIGIIFIFGLSAFLIANFSRSRPFHSEISLVLVPDPVKINFNFNPAKKEIFSLNLNHLDITKFKALGFSVKKINYADSISLRVEFNSAFKEKSETYFKNISHHWHDYKINLSDFKGISDWSDMSSLAMVVEEWNTKEKKGVVYIDNIRLLK